MLNVRGKLTVIGDFLTRFDTEGNYKRNKLWIEFCNRRPKHNVESCNVRDLGWSNRKISMRSTRSSARRVTMDDPTSEVRADKLVEMIDKLRL
jgi:hypothetical protein